MALRIDLYGSSAFCLPSAEMLLEQGYDLRCVTARLPEEHRSRKHIIEPLAAFAHHHNLPFKAVETKKELEDLYMHAWDAPDAIVVASFGVIIPPSVLTLPKFGVLNIHPSHLPTYRGPSPIQTTLLHNDEHTGVTIILLDEQLDHGPILGAIYPVGINQQDETTKTLKQRLGVIGAHLLAEILPKWTKGEITPTPQDDTKATFTKKISKGDGRIDWNEPAESIERKSRAYDPWPGQWTIWNGAMLKFFGCYILKKESDRSLGTVLGVQDGVLTIQAGNKTVVGFGALQKEGKKMVAVHAFIQGTPAILKGVLH